MYYIYIYIYSFKAIKSDGNVFHKKITFENIYLLKIFHALYRSFVSLFHQKFCHFVSF